MRLLGAILSLVLTVALIYFLNTPVGSLPAFGKLFDPVNGFWANAECVNKDFSEEFEFYGLKTNTSVWFDERLVPHINAENDHDLYFMQGYIHAYFRLWQMDMQTRAAAGRVSEVVGKTTLRYDRGQRRKGMVYGAERSLKAMENDPRTKVALNAYTDGVNAYIASLKERNLPLEYKLMGFKPEPWNNLKAALMLMYMADDLTGGVDDIDFTRLATVFNDEELQFYFPDKNIGSTPVIPVGTIHDSASLMQAELPGAKTSVQSEGEQHTEERDDGKGSNNWVVSGKRTASGYPILCNDPHLGLNLPAIWYEMQLTAPGINTYGVSLPGAPGIIIGFNDNISWGFTNNYRDVKDYYAIDEVDNNSYSYNGEKLSYEKRVEVIAVKDSAEYVDTVKYTIHGPVSFDKTFNASATINMPLAMKWMAHLPSNELLSVYLLNRAKTYNEFVDAISYFICPAQNFIYADKFGNIALWGQGQFVNKWKGQGRYIMSGKDSTTMWGDMIPVRENPHSYNPKQGYLSSANQTVTDSTYPYWYNGYFTEYRAWRINEVLQSLQGVTVEDMFRLQADEHDILASQALPLLLKKLNPQNAKSEYVQWLIEWDYTYDAGSKAATVFRVWWHEFYSELWQHTKFGKLKGVMYPLPERTIQLLQNDTVVLGDVASIVNTSFKYAVDSLDKLKANNNLEWYKVKNTTLRHLARLDAFSIAGLENGGWGTTVNAMKGNHGPSWRMVVEMKDTPVAYGMYPGGQSGNPGSKYYDSYVEKWVNEEYYKLTFISKGNSLKKVKYTWQLKPKEVK